MNDIERAIAILKYYRPVAAFNAGFKGPQSEDVKAFNLALEALEKQLNGGWIPVSQRLPTETERVLVTLENKMVLEVFFINNKFKYQGLMKGGGMEEVCQDNPVIAWQPLPEPYKEVEQ